MKRIKQFLSLILVTAFLPVFAAFPAFADASADVSAALEALDMEQITGSQGQVAADFTLPAEDTARGVKFTWKSEDASSIFIGHDTAYVLQDIGEKEAAVTAVAEKDGVTAEKTFQLTLAPFSYQGGYILNEGFDDELDPTIWQNDTISSSPEAAGNFIGIAKEPAGDGNDPENGIFRVARTQTSDVKGFIHINQGVSRNTTTVYQTRIRAEVQPKNGSNNAYANFWLCRDAGSTIGKYSAFAQGSIGGENGIVMMGTGSSTQRVNVPSSTKQWRTMTFVVRNDNVENSKFDFYVDGIQYADNFDTRAPAAGLSHTAFGLENTYTGEVWMDDFQIYNFPKQAEELLESETLGTADFGNVTDNLVLPDAVAGVENTSITWLSSNEKVITDEGVVTQPQAGEAAAEVSIYAVVSNCGVKSIKEFALTVAPSTESVYLKFLDIDQIVGDQPKDALIKGFQLPQQTPEGYPITWSSSSAEILRIVNNREVLVIGAQTARPVVLTASVTVDGTQESRNFALTVAPQTGSLEGELNLQEIIGNQPADALVEDFSLPQTTAGGYDVEWESSDKRVLFVNEGMAYVIRKAEEQTVTLTANLIKDGLIVPVAFDLKAAKTDEITDFIVNEDFQDTPLGDLQVPAKKPKAEWGVDATITDKHDNLFVGTIEEPGNTSNRIFKLLNEPDGKQNAMAYLNFTGPKKGTTVMEYDFKHISGGNTNMWASGAYGYNAGPTGNFARLPFNETTLTIQHADSLNSIPVSTKKGEWNHLKAVFYLDDLQFDVYLNGDKVAERLGAQQAVGFIRLQMGFANANQGEMWLDNVKVYADPVSVVAGYADSINLGNLEAVIKDLELVEKTPLGNADVLWVSSNPDVISTKGKIHNDTGKDIPVTLWALVTGTIDGKSYRSVKEYQAIVKRPMTDEEAVQGDFEALALDTHGLLLADDLHLTKTGANGSVITWESDHPELISADGIVTRKAYDEEKLTAVTLTATVSKGAAEPKIKSFTFEKVPELNYILDATLSASSDLGNKRVAFLQDNDPQTAWSPESTDKERTLTVTLKRPQTINMIKINGTCPEVTILKSANGSAFTRFANGTDIQFEPTTVQALRFVFSPGDVEINSIGIYAYYTDETAVKADIQSVQEDMGNLDAVTGDIKIPASGKLGSTIKAVSANQNYLTNDGKVTRPSDSDVTVDLTLTFTRGEYTESITLPVTILKAGSSGGSSTPGTIGGGGGGGNGGGGAILSPVPVPEQEQPEPPTVQNAFPDISEYTWATEAINSLAKRNIVSGDEDGYFHPERVITREEFLKLVVTAFSIEADGAESAFADVPKDSWYYDYVSTAYALGIIKGIDETHFGAGLAISRADMTVILYQAAKYANIELLQGEADFKDAASIPSYSIESVGALSAMGVVNGFEDGTFGPNNQTSRAQAAVMVYRLAEKL